MTLNETGLQTEPQDTQLVYIFGTLDEMVRPRRFEGAGAKRRRQELRQMLVGARTPYEVYRAFDQERYWDAYGVVKRSTLSLFLRKYCTDPLFCRAVLDCQMERMHRLAYTLYRSSWVDIPIWFNFARSLFFLLLTGFVIGLIHGSMGRFGNIILDPVTVGVCLGFFLLIFVTSEIASIGGDVLLNVSTRKRLARYIEDEIDEGNR